MLVGMVSDLGRRGRQLLGRVEIREKRRASPKDEQQEE